MKKIVLVAALIGSLVNLFSQCSTTSILGGHIIYNDLTASPVIWNNLAGAENSDNVRSQSGLTVGTNSTVYTSDLWAQTFLLTVPSNAIICGVEVWIERRQTGVFPGISSVKDNSVRLISNMTVTGTEHASANVWSSADQVEVFGGVGDLWGLPLTPALVNAPDFGVAISAKLENTGAATPLSAQVDKISLIIYYSLPLPVELLSFDAAVNNRNVNLSWVTASETNNAYFILERSTDAINWNNLTTISGNGTSNIHNNYNWVDQDAPDGVVYYNLKQVDHNGDSEYLGATTVTINPNNDPDLIFDPLTSTIQLSGVDQSGQSTFTILDISGKQIFFYNIQPEQTEIQLTEQPSPGIYFFQLMAGGKTILKKIMLG